MISTINWRYLINGLGYGIGPSSPVNGGLYMQACASNRCIVHILGQPLKCEGSEKISVVTYGTPQGARVTLATVNH